MWKYLFTSLLTLNLLSGCSGGIDAGPVIIQPYEADNGNAAIEIQAKGEVVTLQEVAVDNRNCPLIDQNMKQSYSGQLDLQVTIPAGESYLVATLCPTMSIHQFSLIIDNMLYQVDPEW